eukprot:TRINITY_DN4785_c0_g1_i1.p2 TRINITY_DN4785_c0_g1~~TRINITY_DN4785_c0_g1_i1.p2  ORF type:complete len:56 (-),score=11.40 TRINITY_DN4785_c0_g1_i1:28-195(-)
MAECFLKILKSVSPSDKLFNEVKEKYWGDDIFFFDPTKVLKRKKKKEKTIPCTLR